MWPESMMCNPSSSLSDEIMKLPMGRAWEKRVDKMGNRSRREAARSTARMEGKLYKGQDYKTEFQPRDYLKTFYAFDSGTVAENEILKFNLNNLFETFSPGECLVSISGRRWGCALQEGLLVAGDLASGTPLT